MAEVLQEKVETGTKAKDPASVHSPSRNNQSKNRMANKQRRKKAHKRNLKRSNTNG